MEQLDALNIQLTASQEQIALLSQAIDRLRNESASAITNLQVMLDEESKKTRTLSYKPKDLNLVNTKTFEGGKFGGTKLENFKSLDKRVNVCTNSQHRGFRVALEQAEEQLSKVTWDVLKFTSLEFAVEANKK